MRSLSRTTTAPWPVSASAGQIAPTSAAGVVAAPYATYTPSLVEIAILLGAAAFVALGYTIAERYLDLRETEAHAFIRIPRFWAHEVAPAPWQDPS